MFSESYKRVCLLIYGVGCPGLKSLDEVNSMWLETFYRCNAFQGLHNWWVHDDWLHLWESPSLTPTTMKPHRNLSTTPSSRKQLYVTYLYCNQILTTAKFFSTMHIVFFLCSSWPKHCTWSSSSNYPSSFANELWALGPCDYGSMWLQLIFHTQQH